MQSTLLRMASLSPSSIIDFQMESIIPFPISPISITSCECKFLGTLVFNHLPPSDHKRQTSQSTSSDLRRLNRGNCCTLKFSLSFLKGSYWILGFSSIQFQALNYKFSKKVIHKGKMVICILKSQTLTFGSKSSFKNHISSRHVEI